MYMHANTGRPDGRFDEVARDRASLGNRPSNDVFYQPRPQPVYVPRNDLNMDLGSNFMPKEDFSKFEISKNKVEDYEMGKKK